jgi:hypothetical protein
MPPVKRDVGVAREGTEDIDGIELGGVGRMRGKEACEVVGLCLRRVGRVPRAQRKEWAIALAHRNGVTKSHPLNAGIWACWMIPPSFSAIR